MKSLFLTVLLAVISIASYASGEETIASPDGKLTVTISDADGKPTYKVDYQGTAMLLSSPLGITTEKQDLTQGLTLAQTEKERAVANYTLRNIKQSNVNVEATRAVCHFQKEGKQVLDIIFWVSNRDVAFRYVIYPQRDKHSCVIKSEATGFQLPDGTTTFLCPQMKPMTGFAGTAPSYETNYETDAPMGTNGWGGGFTFPCLFKVGQNTSNDKENSKQTPLNAHRSTLNPHRSSLNPHRSTLNTNWVLISEAGTDGSYCGCRLLNEHGGLYRIGFPQEGECNGIGSVTPSMPLPATTPWRTITVGPLANIVETTVPFDVTAPKYEASQEYVYGKGSWSWIIGMDPSCNYDEQKRYIDFSAAMGYQSVLVDALWDRQIGYEGIERLARYGKEKGVALFLWYNSNGSWNDAPQSPLGKMNNIVERRKEMKWMRDAGIRGIKVDFFGGDKQQTLQLYEDILADANDYGLLVIFHGCTLPRGWERMYPNYAASEAVLASENLHFSQGMCDAEARNACIHPFIRNTVGSMDFGGSTLNKYYGADNKHGNIRRTSDVFALAIAVLFQSAVQHFALAPNNLTDAPAWAIDFMKQVPTTWDETRFIDGYPGKYVIMARRCGDRWFVVGINAEKKPLQTTLTLPMFAAGTDMRVYSDDSNINGSVKTVRQNKKQQIKVTIPCNGGLVITQ